MAPDRPQARPTGLVDEAFWEGKKVLLTGHTGFKGSWLTIWLRRLGAEVTGISDGVPTDPSLFALADVEQLVTHHEVDVRDAAAVAEAVAGARPDVVIHMAAQPLVRLSFAEPRMTYETNVMGTVNVLDAVRATPSVGAVVVVTSDKCYLNRGWEWGYREDEPLGGEDPYSSSKACAELVTAAYRSSYFASPDGPRVGTARAGNVIGGGDFGEDRLVPDVMRAAAAGEPVTSRNPAAVRPWQHVLAPLSGYLMLAERLCDSSEYATAFNFGPPESDAQTVGSVVDRMAELWPEGIERHVPGGDTGPPEARTLKLDSSRARERLGWEPPWTLDEALRAVVDWYATYRDRGDVRAVVLDQIAAFSGESGAGAARSARDVG